MNCDEFVELVTAFLEHTLDAGTESRFVDHLSMCDGCERYLDQFRRTISALGELPAESLSPRARAELLDAFRSWQG
jgi:hypothetical protein